MVEDPAAPPLAPPSEVDVVLADDTALDDKKVPASSAAVGTVGRVDGSFASGDVKDMVAAIFTGSEAFPVLAMLAASGVTSKAAVLEVVLLMIAVEVDVVLLLVVPDVAGVLLERALL